MTPGALTVYIDDRRLVIDVEGTSTHTVDVGPLTLVDFSLGASDPPTAADLTNALGLVHDHLDDLIIRTPSIVAVPAVVLSGPHALAMARVEIGTDDVPAAYELTRADADEVFRTLAVETVAERRHNPGLPAEHVESIIASCCVILAIMRRLELRALRIVAGTVPGIPGMPATGNGADG